MQKKTSYDARIHQISVRKGEKVTTYSVRWQVGGKRFKKGFRNKAQADSYRATLITAARSGEPFDMGTGEPISWKQNANAVTWYTFSLDYAKAKWPFASPNHRRGIAEALTDATEVLLTSTKGAPPRKELRAALRSWAYSGRLQNGEEPPEELTRTLSWLEHNTIEMTEFEPDERGPELVRVVLDRLSVKQDGEPAAGSTAYRKRVTFHNALQFACENRVLTANPLHHVQRARPRTIKALDMRVVVNPEQASRLLNAVRRQGQRGPRMVAFFAVMYYGGLRPEEAVDLRPENLTSLPDNGWGEMQLWHSEPRSGSSWTNSGKARDRQPLKHRAPGDSRPVPLHPELVRLLREHIKEFHIRPGQRLFTGPRAGIMTDRTYLAVWHAARNAALTPEEAASPLARRPYDLRHAALSTWLSAGVSPAQAAAWAGNSVAVLLRVYAKCIAGQAQESMRRILEATEGTPRAEEAEDPGAE